MSRFTTSSIAAVALAGVLGLASTAWAQGPWQAPASEKGKKSPGGNAANGKKLADTNCVSCHGAGGKGDGAAAAALNPKPADWTSAKVQGESDGEIFWKISNGRGPMPPWKHLSEKDRWDLVAYVRSLKK
ncbi:MAG: cytochrome c [Candidatus Rokubacteria bacterium]|nr:cytochrome c [Candidatus Rokubacteria bacterium]